MSPVNWKEMKMTTHFPSASLDVAAGATQEPSLPRRFFDALMERQRRKADRALAKYLRNNQHRMDKEFRRELERRLLGQ
jgi:hypothetical protein